MSREVGEAVAIHSERPEREEVVGKPPLEQAADAAEEMYHLRDTFFPRDPAEKAAVLRTRADAALALLDSLPPEQRKSSQQRAIYEYLRGKILDVSPDYYKEAEDHLSKAVKLNPSLVDAWLSLGNCIWKKGDLVSAKNCFSLALSKGAHKKILCQLSMLERSMAQVMAHWEGGDGAHPSTTHGARASSLDWVGDGDLGLVLALFLSLTACDEIGEMRRKNMLVVV